MGARAADVARGVGEIASRWAEQRGERQSRRQLDRADLDALRDAGLLTLAVPTSLGGRWEGVAASVRAVCDVYRTLGAADPSVALVASMHQAVLSFWLASPDPSQPGWEEQRRAVFASALAGDRWGTITSEPGSGGDMARTRAVATPVDGGGFLPGRAYAVTGDEHFGSGMGLTDRMMTTAVPEGEPDPTIFVLDVRDRPWDGSAGLRLVAEWDGAGMAATQSHAMRLDGAPSVRLAWARSFDELTGAANPSIATLYTAVVLGVLDAAIAAAREQVRARAPALRAYEQVECQAGRR